MRLVTFRNPAGAQALGVVVNPETILDVASAIPGHPDFASMISLIQAGPAALAQLREWGEGPQWAHLPLKSTELLAPIPVPPRLRAFSLDPLHLRQATEGRIRLLAEDAPDPEAAAEEAIAKLPAMPAPGWYDTPVYWLMDHLCVAGPDERVTWPEYSDWVDYELEIAAVAWGGGSDIVREDAGGHIFGYTIFNDLSARDAQIAATVTGLSVTAKGKDFAGSYVMGPCIVTADEIDPRNLEGILRVNGEEWGRGSTRNQFWSFEDGIAHVSQASALVPGEVFTSSTIANCSGLELARRGARGDQVELEVPGLGCLRTWIV